MLYRELLKKAIEALEIGRYWANPMINSYKKAFPDREDGRKRIYAFAKISEAIDELKDALERPERTCLDGDGHIYAAVSARDASDENIVFPHDLALIKMRRLTDEEIFAACENVSGLKILLSLARAIEKAHGIE